MHFIGFSSHLTQCECHHVNSIKKDSNWKFKLGMIPLECRNRGIHNMNKGICETKQKPGETIN